MKELIKSTFTQFAHLTHGFISKPHFLVINFHSVLPDKEFDQIQNILDPGIHFKLSQFEELILSLKKLNYDFVDPQNMILKSLKNVMITIDDGYKNNLDLIKILKKYEVPVLLFINTSFIINQKMSEWDEFYIYGIKQGLTRKEILQCYPSRKGISFKLGEPFKSLLPLSFNDLKNLTNEKLITIGNHSHSHELLSKMSAESAIEDIKKAQFIFNKELGLDPAHYAFPEGDINFQIEEELRKMYKFIYTTKTIKNSIDLKNFYIHRFTVNSSQKINYQLARFFYS